MTIKEKEFLGSGWAFPVTFLSGNKQLMITSYEKNIENTIDVIVQTSFGERIMEPQFGSGLRGFFFQKMTPTLKGGIKDAIMSALLDNEPRITVLEVTVDFIDMANGLVEVTIDYEFNQTNTRHNYVYPFYIKEGTNLIK